MVRESINYFHKNYDELTKIYGHKYLLIYNSKIIDVFDDESTALQEACKKYVLGTFIIQETGIKKIPSIGPIIR